MALQIRTTGVEDYIGDSANIKVLVLGGPGVGKTRSSSFWPKPIYADCENGRGSIADRNVPYAEIKSSQDMLDFLAHLKGLERIPKAERQFQTVVIDTLDAFMRKVKDEWILQTKSQSFKGYEAWGYLDSKMQALLTRLLNLDYNVLCLVHHKTKTVKDGESETRETSLQLQGDIATTIYNDFDLVGRMDTYYDTEDGEKVEKRGLSFEKTHLWPMVKDRFGVMPKWVPITFTDADFTQLRDAFLTRLNDLAPAEAVGEIAPAAPELVTSGLVVGPTGGALPPMDPKDVPLEQFDKVTLAKMCRDAVPPITTTVDGQAIKGNTIKAELVAALKLRRELEAEKAETDVSAASAEQSTSETSPAQEPSTAEPVTPEIPTQREPAEEPAAPVEAVAQEAAVTTPVEAAPALVDTPDAGPVNVETGEITQDQAVALVSEQLGAEVVSQLEAVEVPTPGAQSAPEVKRCGLEGCDEVLSTQENADLVKISYIKYRDHYCNDHFLKAKALLGNVSRPLTPDELQAVA